MTSTPAPQQTQSTWLIECGEHKGHPLYWCVDNVREGPPDPAEPRLTYDLDSACHFARKADAERVRDWIAPQGKVVESRTLPPAPTAGGGGAILREQLEKLLEMPPTCITDVEVLENIKRRSAASAALASPPAPAPTVEGEAKLRAALQELHDDCVEYASINNLHNSDGSPATNHALRRAMAALAEILASPPSPAKLTDDEYNLSPIDDFLLSEKQATLIETMKEALRAALNMVDGDGAPPDWDTLRTALASPPSPAPEGWRLALERIAAIQLGESKLVEPDWVAKLMQGIARDALALPPAGAQKDLGK